MQFTARRDGGYRLGWHLGYQHPGLFQGLAGIAYGWARLADPGRIGSVALWAIESKPSGTVSRTHK